MVEYADEDLIEAPRDIVWKLLLDHLDDAKAPIIHPLIRSQTTLHRTESEAVVDRVVEVRRKPVKSRWKVTFHPPERYRWEFLEGTAPWTVGDFLELSYAEAPGGTRVTARGNLTISVLPFFLSQNRTVRSVLNDLRTEDVFFLRRYRY